MCGVSTTVLAAILLAPKGRQGPPSSWLRAQGQGQRGKPAAPERKGKEDKPAAPEGKGNDDKPAAQRESARMTSPPRPSQQPHPMWCVPVSENPPSDRKRTKKPSRYRKLDRPFFPQLSFSTRSECPLPGRLENAVD